MVSGESHGGFQCHLLLPIWGRRACRGLKHAVSRQPNCLNDVLVALHWHRLPPSASRMRSGSSRSNASIDIRIRACRTRTVGRRSGRCRCCGRAQADCGHECMHDPGPLEVGHEDSIATQQRPVPLAQRRSADPLGVGRAGRLGPEDRAHSLTPPWWSWNRTKRSLT